MHDEIEKWVVYSTFHPQGASAGYCADQLSAYRACGFRVLVVDTSPRLTNEREACWRSLATCWFQRDNVGHDFGSYAAGLRWLTVEQGRSPAKLAIVLTNDSCYGPYVPFDNFFRLFDAHPRSSRLVFGMTESLYFSRHLQSYWLYFRPDVTPLALEFFESMPPSADREAAVKQGELGLSRFLLERGCELVVPHGSEALLERFSDLGPGRFLSVLALAFRRIWKRPRYSRNGDAACIRRYLNLYHAFNPTAAFGIHMHVLGLTPFVKRQLLRENPNADRLVPVLTPEEMSSNEKVFLAIRRSALFRKRYGRDEASRPYAVGGRVD